MLTSTICLFGTLLMGAVASPIEARQAVPRGPEIWSCTKPNTVALTFDDGPHIYTAEALDKLDAAGMKATFFVNGQNFGNINDHTAVLKRMRETRHQIGSHTWSHINMADKPNEVRAEMLRLEDTLRKNIGYWPTYMRPPFLAYSSANQALMTELSYRVVQADLDTKDYEGNIDASFRNFVTGLNAGKSIVLNHDVHEKTVRQLLPLMIAELQRRGLKSVTVGECLGEAYNLWYRVNPR